MTCIIAAMTDDEVVFVSDSLAVNGSWKSQSSAKKVLVHRGRIFGFSGALTECQKMMRWIVDRGDCTVRRLAREIKSNVIEDRELDVLAYEDGSLWEIEPDGCVERIEKPFHAIGCMAIVTGAMEALWRHGDPKLTVEDVMRISMGIAAQYHTNVDDRLQWERLKR